MKTFLWAGADIFVCSSELGHRKCVVIEVGAMPGRGAWHNAGMSSNTMQMSYRW